MHHTAAWSTSIATGVETALTAVTDGVLTIQNGNFLPPRDLPIWYAAGMATNIQRARFDSGSLRIPSTPYLRPLMAALIPNDPVRMAWYKDNPLNARMQEELRILAFQNAAGAQRVTVVAGFGLDFRPMPLGNITVMRGVSTTAVVANAWTPIAVTWQDSIAQGQYAIVGMEHQSANGQGARLYILDQYWKPGCVSNPALTDVGYERFRYGSLGEWGRFNANYLPTVEVLANAADAAHEIYLYFVRVAGSPIGS